jgi:porin
VRARATLSDQLTLLLAVFNGNPAGPGVDDPQNLDPHGLNFRLRDSALLMGELQYSYKIDPQRPARSNSVPGCTPARSVISASIPTG